MIGRLVADNELNMEARDHNLISRNKAAFAGNEENQNKKRSLLYRPKLIRHPPEYIARILNHLTATFGHPVFLSACQMLTFQGDPD
jgi:hypothetical protein